MLSFLDDCALETTEDGKGRLSVGVVPTTATDGDEDDDEDDDDNDNDEDDEDDGKMEVLVDVVEGFGEEEERESDERVLSMSSFSCLVSNLLRRLLIAICIKATEEKLNLACSVFDDVTVGTGFACV